MHNDSDFDLPPIIESEIIQSVEVSRANAKASQYAISPVTMMFVTVLTCFVVMYNRRRARMVRLIGKVPGPAAMPIVGNAIECNVDHDGGWWCGWVLFVLKNHQFQSYKYILNCIQLTLILSK